MIRGFADVHCHQFAQYAFGGRLFWGNAYGDPSEELAHCTPAHGPGGTADFLGNWIRTFSLGLPFPGAFGHLVGGFPQFDGWPRWDSTTHQAVFEDWLLRAVDGGLRLMVMLAVNNEPLSALAHKAPGRTADDMEAVDLQLSGARAMEQYVDTKAGGPGLGWYRIVTTPAEARRVAEAGKLAVVLGIEVDYLFGAHGEEDLSPMRLRAELDRYYDLGVRHIFPIHFADNGFGGASFDKVLQSTREDRLLGNPVLAPYPLDVEDGRKWGYAYRGGKRNVRGLTELGKVLVRECIVRGIVIEVDHMSARSREDTFAICRDSDYPVSSGHTGFVEIANGDKRHEGNLLPDELDQIRDLGGMVSVIVRQGDIHEIATWEGSPTTIRHTSGASTNTLVQAYLYAASKMAGHPVGLGTDFNGFAGLPRPRFGSEAEPPTRDGRGQESLGAALRYPFEAAATGRTLQKSTIGMKEFDIAFDGLAHVGMLPDLVNEFMTMGLTAADMEPLLSSAEGYIALWEKCDRNKAIPEGPRPTGDALNPGDVLHPGEEILSQNSQYRLAYQLDGNVVLYRGTRAVWDAGTTGAVGAVAIRPGGSLIVVRPSAPTWVRPGDARAQPESRLVVQDDGNIVIYSRDDVPTWSSNTGVPTGPAPTGDTMRPGDVLTPGGELKSANTRYRLVYQTDGNLVLYGPDGALWDAKTTGPAGAVAMQAAGNLVVYAPGHSVWAEPPQPQPQSRLVVQDDGNIVIYSRDDVPTWSSNTGVPTGPAPTGDTMRPGDVLTPGGELKSANTRYRLVYQTDGNLVLYGPDGALWDAKTTGPAGAVAMQAAGNLVVYAPGHSVWAEPPQPQPQSRLVVQDDGNIVIYSRDDVPTWSSNTGVPTGPAPTGDTMRPGDVLTPGGELKSANTRYRLVYQADGNLVLYGPDGALWDAKTTGPAGAVAMQAAGNLVVYAPGHSVWAEPPQPQPQSRLVVQDDGNIVIYSTDNEPLWDRS